MHNRHLPMHLVPVSVESIRLHQPLPFPLMDKNGILLAKRSFIIDSKEYLAEIAQRGGGLFIDVADSEAHHRAYVERLHGLVRDGKSLGEIANAKITGDILGTRSVQDDERPDWLDLQVQGNSLLRDSNPAQFMERLDRLNTQLDRHSHRNPDGTLFALIQLSATEVRMYSATHAMLVSVMCGLAAREVLKWPTDQEALLCKAALTMNLGMTGLQDQLTKQVEAPSPAQRKSIDEHAAKSADMLAEMGVADENWLEAVRQHHTQTPGPLRSRPLALQMARLIQRADMFAARLAPRASRVPISPAAAMQACYFDEVRQVDETGAALIKAVGIYQPGSFVRLATDEVAVVVKRGFNTSTPRVAVLISRSGMPTMEPTVRDTSTRDFRIVASIPHRDVKVQVNLERLLPLTATPASDRPW
jgi:HD-GYP domain-containing protein (c-di-GMP phosphodiesterase class II)